jgi:PAS domain S-box-containing protein
MMHAAFLTDSANDPPGIDYRALTESLPAVLYTAAWDEARGTIYTSPQIEALLGFTQAEWLTNPVRWQLQLHADDRERVLAALARFHAGAEPEPLDYRMLARDGAVRWVRDMVAVLRDPAGRPTGICGVRLDITHEKELEWDLEMAQRALEQAARPQLDVEERALLRRRHALLRRPASTTRWQPSRAGSTSSPP